eukprot:gb/GEZN01005998.1/.p1 GENE.gb/GEZN01005998.1/~~gb/GEZN01005998.1/.p1  ORF type:complete len:509 (+),score=64.64 gb/GEZN01005998.1/:59-1585(+)
MLLWRVARWPSHGPGWSCAFSTQARSAVKPIPGPTVAGEHGTYPDFMARAAKMGNNQRKAFNSYYSEYGPVVQHEWGPNKVISLFHPDDILEVCRNEGPFPITAASMTWPTNVYTDWKGIVSMTKPGPESKELRRKLQKDIFPPSIADSYLPLIDPAAHLAAELCPNGERFDAIAPNIAFDMFCSVFLGINPKTVLLHHSEEEQRAKVHPRDKAFVESAMAAFRFIGSSRLKPPASPDGDPEAWQDFLTHFVKPWEYCQERGSELAAQALNQARDDDTKTKSYLVRLLERDEISVQDAGVILNSLLAAGVDTTSYVMQWLVLNLAENPKVQAKLREEVLGVLGPDAPLTSDKTNSLPYLKWCIRESHRLTPPNYISTMRMLSQDIEIQGYTIPSHTQIWFGTGAVQMDPAVVEQPERFWPERWSPEEQAKRKGVPSQVLDHKILRNPFGFGPRMCMGARVAEAELECLISRMVRTYEFQVWPANQEYVPLPVLFLKPDPWPTLKWSRV